MKLGPLICCAWRSNPYGTTWGGWVSLFGYGIWIGKYTEPLLFSERYRHVRWWKLGPVKIKVLTPTRRRL